MHRSSSITILILLLALVACGGKKTATESAASSRASATVASASAQPAACPTAATRKLAKTRFVANAGLAGGAFKRYIYTPYKEGRFASGAHGQKRAIVKAGLAGVFTIDQLRRARNNVEADPTLCKALKAPIVALTTTMGGLVSKLKAGNVNAGDIAGGSGALESFRTSATNAGAGFQDKNVPEKMIGG